MIAFVIFMKYTFLYDVDKVVCEIVMYKNY